MTPPALDAGDLPAPPRQKRSRATRDKLLAAARALFAEHGYHATAVEQIAERANTATGAFYIYFRSKRQLLIVLVTELLHRLAALDLRPKGGADIQAGLRRFLTAAFLADRKYYGVVRAWQEAALTDPTLHPMQSAIEQWTQARIERVFRALQRYPTARPGRDVAAFARMMDRHFWSILARGAQLTDRELSREIRIAADVIDHYMFRDSVH